MMDADPDDISGCSTDAERARWLLTCPLARLMHDEGHIRRWLQNIGFQSGIAYLETELAALRRARCENGDHYKSMNLQAARGGLYRVALCLPPR